MFRWRRSDWLLLDKWLPVALFMVFVTFVMAVSGLIFEGVLAEAGRAAPLRLIMLALFLFPATVSGVTDLLLGVAAGWLLALPARRWPAGTRVLSPLAWLSLALGGGLLLLAGAGCLPLLLRLPAFSLAVFTGAELLPLEWAAALTGCRPAGPAAAVLLAADDTAAAAAYRAVVRNYAGLWLPHWGLGLFWLALGARLRQEASATPASR